MEATGSSQKDNEDFEEGHMVAVKLPDNPAPFIIAERCEVIKSDDEVEASVSDNTAVDVWWYGILKNHGEIEKRVCAPGFVDTRAKSKQVEVRLEGNEPVGWRRADYDPLGRGKRYVADLLGEIYCPTTFSPAKPWVICEGFSLDNGHIPKASGRKIRIFLGAN